MARPDTINEAAQLAYDTVLAVHPDDTELAVLIRDAIHDAYRTGWNRGLEGAALELEMYAQDSAAHRVRNRKITKEAP